MANVMKNEVKYTPWKEGMRVTGKMEMPPKDYGEYLMRSGKSAQNHRRRSRAAKMS